MHMIVVSGFPLKVAIKILGVICSILFSDLCACGLRSIPTPPIVELVLFFQADAVTKVQFFPKLCCLIGISLW